jgi:hypothetical protein
MRHWWPRSVQSRPACPACPQACIDSSLLCCACLSIKHIVLSIRSCIPKSALITCCFKYGCHAMQEPLDDCHDGSEGLHC